MSNKLIKVKQPRKKIKYDSILTTITPNDEITEWIHEFEQTPIEKKICEVGVPWIERFRPQKLEDIIDHEIYTSVLKNFIKKKQFPNLLLTGPPGTGKTSTIISCAKELYKENYSVMVLEINASEERGIDMVRNKIKNFIMTKGVFLSPHSVLFKLVILDEADAMTSDAQSMLVNIMEKYILNVRFCLVCNYTKKISLGIQSRCVIFKFYPLKQKNIENYIQYITKSLGFNINNDGIRILIKTGNGDLRKVLNTLQATHMAYNDVDETKISDCICYPLPQDIKQIHTILTNENLKNSYNLVTNIIKEKGYTLLDIIHEIYDMYMEKYLLTNYLHTDNDVDFKNSKFDIITFTSLLRDIEANLTMCQTEDIQLAGFISAYTLCRQ